MTVCLQCSVSLQVLPSNVLSATRSTSLTVPTGLTTSLNILSSVQMAWKNVARLFKKVWWTSFSLAFCVHRAHHSLHALCASFWNHGPGCKRELVVAHPSPMREVWGSSPVRDKDFRLHMRRPNYLGLVTLTSFGWDDKPRSSVCMHSEYQARTIKILQSLCASHKIVETPKPACTVYPVSSNTQNWIGRVKRKKRWSFF
jgi:hypothetical protein